MQRQGMKQTEDQLQSACVKWFAMQYPKLWETKRLFSVPNAAKRGPALAATMKRTGMQAGVSDLFLSIPRGVHAGAFFELKVGKNTLTDEQRKFIHAHQDEYACHVIRSLDEFMEAVKNYFKY